MRIGDLARAVVFVILVSAAFAGETADAAGRADFVPLFQSAAARAHEAVQVDVRTQAQRAHLDGLRRQQLVSLVTSTAIDAISRYPGRVRDIMGAAAQVAPDAAASVAKNVVRTYPGFANDIAAATGAPLHRPQSVRSSPAPSYYAAAPAAPSATLPVPPGGETAATAIPWALGSIAVRPDLVSDIVRQAIARAPADRTEIVDSLSRAYPAFAGRIAAAAANAASAPPSAALPMSATAAPPVAPATLSPAPAAPAGASMPSATAPNPPSPPTPREATNRNPSGPSPAVPLPAAPMPQPATTGKSESDATLVAFDEAAVIYDPIEPANRVIFALNDTIDFVLLRPIAWTYNKITPDPVIFAIRRFFRNLDAPVIFANDVLQGDFGDAMVTAGRFGINTTIGILGFFDFAEDFGLERHHADFGQTLHSYGSGPGPYLVIPVLGPSNARDAVGLVGDFLMNPLTWLLEPEQQLIVTASRGIVRREELLTPLDELRESSVDYYTALKSAFYQHRKAQLQKSPEGFKSGMDTEEYDKLFDQMN